MPSVSLACIGCGRQPWQLGKKKFQVCPWCAKANLPATFLCGPDCPANPWPEHKKWHKELKKRLEEWEDGGAAQQQNREAAEHAARIAERTGDEYDELMAGPGSKLPQGPREKLQELIDVCLKSERFGAAVLDVLKEQTDR